MNSSGGSDSSSVPFLRAYNARFRHYILNHESITSQIERKCLRLGILGSSYEDIANGRKSSKGRRKQIYILILLLINACRTLLLLLLPKTSPLIGYLGDNYRSLDTLKYPVYLGFALYQLQSLFIRILMLYQESNFDLSLLTDGPSHEDKVQELTGAAGDLIFILKFKIWLAYQCGSKIPYIILLLFNIMELYSVYRSFQQNTSQRDLLIMLSWSSWIIYPNYLLIHDIVFTSFATLASTELLKMQFDRLDYILDSLKDTAYRIGPGVDHIKMEVFSVLDHVTNANRVLRWVLFYMINFNTISGASFVYLTFNLQEPVYRSFFAFESLTVIFFLQYIPARMARIAHKVSVVYKKIFSVYTHPVVNNRMRKVDKMKMQLMIELIGDDRRPVCIYSLNGSPFLRMNQFLIVVELVSNSLLFAQLYGWVVEWNENTINFRWEADEQSIKRDRIVITKSWNVPVFEEPVITVLTKPQHTTSACEEIES